MVKDILGFEPIFGYATYFLSGHRGKSPSQSTAIKLQQRAARLSSQRERERQPYTSPAGSAQVKNAARAELKMCAQIWGLRRGAGAT